MMFLVLAAALACDKVASTPLQNATVTAAQPVDAGAMQQFSNLPAFCRVAVKGVRSGEGVGYGVTFHAEQPTAIAIVPAGYADGLDLRLAGRGSILIRGRRAPVVGSVCMDMLIADVTGLDVSPGDEVVVIGSQGADRIGVREMAAQIGTIPYEILCRIGSRIERVYT